MCLSRVSTCWLVENICFPEAASSLPIISPLRHPPPLRFLRALRRRRWLRSFPSRPQPCLRQRPTARWTGPTTPTSPDTASVTRCVCLSLIHGWNAHTFKCLLLITSACPSVPGVLRRNGRLWQHRRKCDGHGSDSFYRSLSECSSNTEIDEWLDVLAVSSSVLVLNKLFPALSVRSSGSTTAVWVWRRLRRGSGTVPSARPPWRGEAAATNKLFLHGVRHWLQGRGQRSTAGF